MIIALGTGNSFPILLPPSVLYRLDYFHKRTPFGSVKAFNVWDNV